jgi:hypothetical protein
MFRICNFSQFSFPVFRKKIKKVFEEAIAPVIHVAHTLGDIHNAWMKIDHQYFMNRNVIF